ncbi:MAG: serine/threonine phosphatase [Cyanobacteria bacterium]|nr:serine/threonine phosphatase [Cyanobacteria bacterium CG_2015-16_32_12]NCO78916.1 serine/threonine phosphatase [Cyanobacteria bacterium CG_2015-22_32_23]NCQ04993.1 serine/threonine phosphatase [Cyanobacteria bacterium CG_2015-09_32_10]NCQ42979.1 serine/threonine phosphatase [Cyanobacteria bacterium CG_2015-04_32_10]NCS85543.1 serine/threonine phosphatase [Cyanobacteria bacterium CG_2015-02_32_10]
MTIDRDLMGQVYQCIIVCPLSQSPKIPFVFSPNSSHRYALTTPISDISLSPFLIVGDRHYFCLDVVDTKPTERGILDENLDHVERFERDSLKEAGIPDLAFTYLTLTEYSPTVPELFDGWEDKNNHQEFVIITSHKEDQKLEDYFQNNNFKIAEVLPYLQKTAKLWKSFAKIDCCETLLRLDNLKVDLDGTLIIDKIYLDFPNDPPLLRQLVETWANLLGDSHDDYKSFITDLMIQIESGDIDDIQQLRSELQLLAQEIEMQSLLEQEEDKEGEEMIIIPGADELNELVNQFDFEESEIQDATQINNPSADDQPTIVLPMRLLSLTEVGLSDIGRKRGHNEDCFAIETNIQKKESPQGTYYNAKGFFVVCDGMGGHASGEVASAMAVKTLYNYFQKSWVDELPSAETIKDGILQANEVIYGANIEKGQTGSGRMGTTLVMTLIQGTKAVIAHVGDSRIYRVNRKWGLEQLTVDHSVAQAEIKHGIESDIAFARPDAFQLTQALGPRDNTFVNPDINFLDIKEDTLFVMCSDGLSDNDLLENHWETALLPLISSKANLDEGITQIIDLGNQFNGHDNITCVLIRIKVQPNLEHQNAIFQS